MSSLPVYVPSAEEELQVEWFKRLARERNVYREPHVDAHNALFVKRICDYFNRSVTVFIMCMDLLEEYLDRNSCSQNDLTVVVVIFMCSKIEGPILKIQDLQRLLDNTLKCPFSAEAIKQKEVDILFSCYDKLPIITKIDELNTFLDVYFKQVVLNIDIQALCVQILNIVYLSMKSLFAKLKTFYSANDEAQGAFKNLFINKLYFPSGITFCAIKITQRNDEISWDQINSEYLEICSINFSHISFLANCITEIVVADKNLVLC